MACVPQGLVVACTARHATGENECRSNFLDFFEFLRLIFAEHYGERLYLSRFLQLTQRLQLLLSTMHPSPTLFSLYSSFFSRRRGGEGGGENGSSCALPRSRHGSSLLPLQQQPAARLDHHESWRIFMGGHDPATPFAEALINLHNHNVMWMIFVTLTVLWPFKSRH
ncbi:hypothetical protein Efla_004645 [Eimeria flavescens]